MAESLVIRLHDDSPERASWIVVDNAGAITGSQGSGELADAVRSSSNRRVIAIVPATDVLLTKANLPVKGAARMLQAVPYALEEQLADDVRKLHFAVGKRADDGQVPVAVARREQVENWLSTLRSSGLSPSAMVPDTALLPPNGAGGPTMVVDGESTYLRQPDESVAVIDSACFADVAEAVGLGSVAPQEDGDKAADADSRASLFISEDDRTRYPELVQAVEQRFPACEVRGLQSGAFPRLAASAMAGPQINLLQGAFAPSHSHAKLWRPWQGPGILLAVLLAVLLGGKLLEVLRLGAIDSALDEQIARTYSQAFPDGRIVDPVAQMRTALARLNSGGEAGDTEFLDMVRITASTLRQTPSAKLQALRYGRNQLEIKLTAPDVDTLDKIRAGLESGSSFAAKIEGAPPRGDVVEGRISMRRR